MLYRQLVLFLSMIVIGSATLVAQGPYNFQPVNDDSIQLLNLRKEIRKRFEKDSAEIDGQNKKYILNIYRERWMDLDELFTNKEPITATDAAAYLTGIANEIVNKNPQLKLLAPRIMFSRGWWPNAYSIGEGTIIFNMDLFIKLKNESQVAFVLCHELAHLYLDHSNKKINKYINTLYSDEFQKKLKQLSKQEYDKNKELEKLELGFAFKSFRHSRGLESEADSAGLFFLKNTSYDCKEALNCIGLLDEIDEEKMDFSKQLPKVFSFADYPFKKRWIEKEAAFFGVTADTKENKPIDDSLKTHPDCKVRIKALTPVIEQLHVQGGQPYLQQQQRFNQLQQQFSFEEVNYCFNSKKISRSLFNAIRLLDQYPGNVYLVSIIGKCFNEMYERQKAHHLNTITDLPSPFREKNYNTLLEFVGRLTLTEISCIGYHFINQFNSTFTGNSEFAKVAEQARKNYNESQNKN